jgi:hypothetical protein
MNSLRKKLSATATAQALLVNAESYGVEKDRHVSRFRLTKNSLEMISGRALLTPQFLQDTNGALWEMNWSMIVLPDGDFAFIETSKIGVWPRVGWGRLEAALRASDPEVAIEVEFNKCFPDFKGELSFDD